MKPKALASAGMVEHVGMGELLALAVLGAWMWREREHSRERRALWERIAGVTVGGDGSRWESRARAFGDAAEWEIEQERDG